MTSKTNVDSCADGHDAPALKLSEALSRILAEVQPVCGGETLPVRNALGRVLSADVVSKINVPSHTNSAMDGYAVIGADLPADGEIRLEVIGTSAAGRPFAGEVASGQCARIMTGAPMPAGTDTGLAHMPGKEPASMCARPVKILPRDMLHSAPVRV